MCALFVYRLIAFSILDTTDHPTRKSLSRDIRNVSINDVFPSLSIKEAWAKFHTAPKSGLCYMLGTGKPLAFH